MIFVREIVAGGNLSYVINYKGQEKPYKDIIEILKGVIAVPDSEKEREKAMLAEKICNLLVAFPQRARQCYLCAKVHLELNVLTVWFVDYTFSVDGEQCPAITFPFFEILSCSIVDLVSEIKGELGLKD